MRRCIAIVAAMLFGLHLGGCDDARPGNSQRTPPPRASVQDGEMCTEHGVPEALCTRCNPALANVFKAKGDWCAEHEFPASFCPVRLFDLESARVGDLQAELQRAQERVRAAQANARATRHGAWRGVPIRRRERHVVAD